MITLPEVVTLPMKMDEHGVIRISETRVTLDSILACYLQGDTPEAIHQGFASVPLTDIYTIIAYYLAHQEEMDAYLKQNELEGERLRQEWESRYPPPTKAELLKRLELVS